MSKEQDEFARLAAERDQRIAEMREGATELFALYNGYVEAGFSEAQAMQLLIAILTRDWGASE